MSRRAKLEISSQCRKRSAVVLCMTLPRGGERAARRSSRQGRGRGSRRPCTPDSNRFRREGLLCLLRQRAERHAGRDEVEVEIEVGDRDKSSGYQERVEGELGHLGIAGEVAVLRVAPPLLPDPPQGHERADEDREIEAEAQEAVL